MANKNTKRKRARGENGYGKKSGTCIDSAKRRAASGKKPADLPARKV